MTIKERYQGILQWFQENMPIAETELEYTNPYELLVAVVLSAQCTDKRVNMTTPKLFHDFPTIESMASTTPEVMYEYIKSITYPNNKSRSLVKMAQKLCRTMTESFLMMWMNCKNCRVWEEKQPM